MLVLFHKSNFSETATPFLRLIISTSLHIQLYYMQFSLEKTHTAQLPLLEVTQMTKIE
jgi:hypothetical protein